MVTFGSACIVTSFLRQRSAGCTLRTRLLRGRVGSHKPDNAPDCVVVGAGRACRARAGKFLLRPRVPASRIAACPPTAHIDPVRGESRLSKNADVGAQLQAQA